MQTTLNFPWLRDFQLKAQIETYSFKFVVHHINNMVHHINNIIIWTTSVQIENAWDYESSWNFKSTRELSFKTTADKSEICWEKLMILLFLNLNPNSNFPWNHTACLKIMRLYCSGFQGSWKILKQWCRSYSKISNNVTCLYLAPSSHCDFKHPFTT